MLAAAAFPSLFAQTGENGLIFTPVSDTEASVSSDSTLTRKADISIPETVTINGHNYTVTEVAPNAFANNTNISSVALPSTLVTIGDHAFDGCTALKSIDLPANLETIGDYAFFAKGGAGLGEITLPSKMKEVGDSAFFNAPLTTLTIDGDSSSGELTLGNAAFSGLSRAIENIYVARATPPKADVSTFNQRDYKSTFLTVFGDAIPSRDLYLTDPVWSLFKQPIITSAADIEHDTETAKSEYFTLGGVYLGTDRSLLSPGIYIHRHGSESEAVYLR